MEPTATGPTEPTATARTEPRRSAPDISASALAQLIGAGAAQAFLKNKFGRDAWRTRLSGAQARSYFDWATLNRALAEHRLGPPRLKLERAGQDVSREAVSSRRTRRGATLQDIDPGGLNAALRAGATLIVDAANELSPPLRQLCARLAAEFGCACQANLYACWGETQGFDVHWDDHDVFVLQVEGRKAWRLYGSTRPSPTRLDFHADHPKPETPIEETVLEPGDLLYMPRGYWHAAVGIGEPSLHLTIGLTRRMGSDFIHWLAEQGLADAAMRADLPLEQDDKALAAHLAELMRRLQARDPAELARAYRRHVASTQAHRPKLSFPFLGRADEDLPAETRLTLADGIAELRPSPATGNVVLSWRGVEFTLARELSTPLQRLIDGEAVTVAELDQCLREPDRRLLPELLAELVGRGVLAAELP